MLVYIFFNTTFIYQFMQANYLILISILLLFLKKCHSRPRAHRGQRRSLDSMEPHHQRARARQWRTGDGPLP